MSYEEKYRRWQAQLRRELEREAFQEKYECYICGRKMELEIHHLIYTDEKEDFFDPRFWLILCKEHHIVARGLKKSRKRAKK